MELKEVMRNSYTRDELKKLCKDINSKTNKPITFVEIGSYMGESSEVFANEFPDGKIYCIDPWKSGYDNLDSASDSDFKDVEEQFNLRMKRFNHVLKIRGESLNYFIDCDVVYIDGNHSYEAVKQDILHWKGQTRIAITGHDYYEDPEILKIHKHVAGVRQAVDEILGRPDIIYGDSSWLKWIK